jgi:hypothetical protein
VAAAHERGCVRDAGGRGGRRRWLARFWFACIPIDGDLVTREAHSHEVSSFGFWPGDDTIGDAVCTPTSLLNPRAARTGSARRFA